MTENTGDIITNAVAALTDAELDAAAAAARVQYWSAVSSDMQSLFENLVAIIDAERIRRARRGFALALTA